MKSNQKTFIISIAIIIVVVIGLGFLLNRPAAPSKYEDFAKTLVAQGAEFYGAFWCPHCQAQEAQFQMSRQSLEKIGLYHECSNADRSQTKICIDRKIESYPTWYFKDGITFTSTSTPTICTPAPGNATEPAICKQIASATQKVYLFKELGFSIRTAVDPVKTGDVWKFPNTASTTGEVPLAFLAEQINYTLPQ